MLPFHGFVFSGMIIGLIGAGLGLGLGLLLCTILMHYDITDLTGGVFYFMSVQNSFCKVNGIKKVLANEGVLISDSPIGIMPIIPSPRME